MCLLSSRIQCNWFPMFPVSSALLASEPTHVFCHSRAGPSPRTSMLWRSLRSCLTSQPAANDLLLHIIVSWFPLCLCSHSFSVSCVESLSLTSQCPDSSLSVSINVFITSVCNVSDDFKACMPSWDGLIFLTLVSSYPLEFSLQMSRELPQEKISRMKPMHSRRAPPCRLFSLYRLLRVKTLCHVGRCSSCGLYHHLMPVTISASCWPQLQSTSRSPVLVDFSHSQLESH